MILSKVDAWTLCPTDLILHLCLHFLKHRVPRNRALFATSAALLQLSDIARTIYYYGDKVDWDDLRHQTYKYHITDLVYTTIKIALETCVNKDDNNSLNLRISDGRYRYKKLMYQRLILHDDMTRAIPDELRLSIVSHNLRSFLRAVIRWLFPAKETLAAKYSVPESANRMYVYYLINPYNLLNTIVLFSGRYHV